MLLNTRTCGDPGGSPVVCVHGITQHGGMFTPLAQALAGTGRRVVCVDLRGHGDSGRLPPWTTETLVEDLLETASAAGFDGAADWIGHSLGGMLVAALAAAAPDRVRRLVLLDPALEIAPEQALLCAENDRLDWSFATPDEAVEAMLVAGFLVAAPRETVYAYAADDLRPGPDGRLRFRFCPSAVVALWGELTRPAPPVARVPTLLVRVAAPLFPTAGQDERYRAALGDRLAEATVPNGHNPLWEAPGETEAVVEGFLDAR